MGFSVTQNLYWLLDHEGSKRGQSANKLRQIALARTKMLCAQGLVGTEEDLKDSASSYIAPAKEEVLADLPVEELVEDVAVESDPSEDVQVELEVKKDNLKKKKW